MSLSIVTNSGFSVLHSFQTFDPVVTSSDKLLKIIKHTQSRLSQYQVIWYSLAQSSLILYILCLVPAIDL